MAEIIDASRRFEELNPHTQLLKKPIIAFLCEGDSYAERNDVDALLIGIPDDIKPLVVEALKKFADLLRDGEPELHEKLGEVFLKDRHS